jgi:hypothetical protein
MQPHRRHESADAPCARNRAGAGHTRHEDGPLALNPAERSGQCRTQSGQGDRTEKKLTAIPALEPSHQAGIGTRTFAKFGENVRVEQVAVHERSMLRGYSPARLKSASGMARSNAFRSGKRTAPADRLSSLLVRKSNSSRCSLFARRERIQISQQSVGERGQAAA